MKVSKQNFYIIQINLREALLQKENLEKYLQQNIIEGSHRIDDVYETINSVKLFDFVVETLNEPLSKRLILEFHRMLKDKTLIMKEDLLGAGRKFPI